MTLSDLKQSRADCPILLLAVVLTAGIFAFDLLTPLGWADGFLYLIPLTFILFRSPRQHHLVGFAALCSVLILLGWLLSPPGGIVEQGQVTYNRLLGITLLWVTALFLRHRKGVEEVLFHSKEESEERFHLLVEHANDAICFIDLHGQIRWASRQATVVSGLTSAELFGRSVLTMLSPAAAVKFEARLAAVRRGEAVAPIVEAEILRPDGSSVWLELNATTVMDSQKPVGRLIVGRDITERRQAEETQRRLVAIVESSDDAIVGKSLDGIIQSWNKGAVKMYGYSVEEMVGRPLSLLAPPDRQEELRGIHEKLRRGEQIKHFETVRVRKDGTHLQVSLSISPIKDETGTIIGASTIAHDISDLKDAEESLRLSNQRLQSALKASKTGLWEWNIRTNEVVFSREWKSQLGYEEHEILNRREEWRSRLHPDDRDRVLSHLKAYLENPVGDYQAEFRLRHKDGSYRWIFTRASLIKDGAGEPFRMRGSHLDVTERKMSEEVLRERDHTLRVQNAAFVELARTKTLHAGDLQRALMSLTEMAGRTMQCERVGMWLFNEDRSVMHCQDLYELNADLHSKGQSLTAADHPAYFRSLEEIRSLAINEVHLDPQAKEFALSYLAPLGITSKLDAPIRLNGRTVGVICHEHVGPTRCWSIEDQQFAGSMADWVSLALEASDLKRTEEALRKSEQQLRGALDERERLSQDLHDNVMQNIYAIGLGLEECLRVAQRDSSSFPAKVREAVTDLNAVIHDIRSYITGVEPKISGGMQLAKELSRLIQNTARCDTLGFHLKLDSMALQRLSGEQANHILYIAREAISNSLRHSRAQTGALSLWLLGDIVRFEVRDDGVGFTGDVSRSQGHGLRNMAARVEKLGGILRVTSEPGNGVGIVVDILLERERVAS